LLSLLLLTAACSPSTSTDERRTANSEPPIRDGSYVETDLGESLTFSTSDTEHPGDLDIPADWPDYIPLMPGSIVIDVTRDDGNWPLLILECPGDLASIDSFYSDYLLSNGWVSAGERFNSSGEDGFRLTYNRDQETLRIQARKINGWTELAMYFFSQDRINPD